MSDWSDVAPGVRALALETPTLPPATRTNTYLLGERDVIVVEPASPHAHEQARLFESIEAAKLTVRAIVLTHHHADHHGAAVALRERTSAPILAHPLTAERVPFRVDSTLEEGASLAGDDGAWRVLHTPGHAPGHIVVSREGTWIVGDMVAGVGTILIEPGDGDMTAYIASLQRMESLASDDAVLLPAHGPPLRPARAVLAHYVAHRLAREARVLAACEETLRDVEVLVSRAYADTPREVWPIAQLSLRAHLAKLVREGRVREEDGGFALRR